MPSSAPDLVDQMQHKVAFLADLRASDPTLRFVLAGHSIGAWMAKEAAASLPAESVAGVVGLFPTLEMLGTTRRGRSLFPLMRLLTPSIVRIVDALSLLPSDVLSVATRLLLGPTISPNTIRCAPSLVSGPVVRNAVVLGYHEMKEVGPMVGAAASPLLALGDRVLLYYGQNDLWNAEAEAEDMAARLPRAAVISDPHGHPHSFCLHDDACADVAAGVWGYLRSILIRSGVRPLKRHLPAPGTAGPPAAASDPKPPGRSTRQAWGGSTVRGSRPRRSASPFRRASDDDDEGGGDGLGAFPRKRAPRAQGRAPTAPSPAPAPSRWRGAAARVMARSLPPAEAFRAAPISPAARQAQAPAPAPLPREASVESTGADSLMDFGNADALQREASLQSVGGMLDRAQARGASLPSDRAARH